MRKLLFSFILILGSFFSAFGKQLAVGDEHYLALKEDGTVWAWGGNIYGQLGDGTTSNRTTPVQVSGLADVMAISACIDYSMALKRNGTVWAWGHNSGDGTRTNRAAQVVGLSGVIAAQPLGFHSLALKSDGTVWAWGQNEFGQLGDGTISNRSTPVQVVGLSDVAAISGGFNISFALKQDGTVWAWGGNYHGGLGDGTAEDRWTPVQVIGLTNPISIGANAFFSAAIKPDGTIWEWGVRFTEIDWTRGWPTNITYTPVQASAWPSAVALDAGLVFSIALANNGTVWLRGQAGDAFYSTDPYTMATNPVPIVGFSDIQAIAAGGFDHILAKKSDGSIWAWLEHESGPVQIEGLNLGDSGPIINPDVQVNNADGPVTVSALTPITVTVQIAPAYTGLDADWWIAAKAFGSWFYLGWDGVNPKWLPVTDSTPMQPIYQGPLAPIGPVPIIESEYWLPRGEYEFFFAVDTVMDGLLTLDALHYDSALLTIQ